MRKAKENVEKHYAVVGVLEELNKTLTVLEHYVPRFFKGAKDVYWSKYNIHIKFMSYCGSFYKYTIPNGATFIVSNIYLSPPYRGHTILTGVHCSRRGADLLKDKQEYIQTPCGGGRNLKFYHRRWNI